MAKLNEKTVCGWEEKAQTKGLDELAINFQRPPINVNCIIANLYINFVFKFLFCLLRKYTTHTTNTYAQYIVILIPSMVEYILCVLLRCVFEFIYKDWARFWRVTVFPSKPQSNPISSGLDWIVFHCHLHRF